MTSIIKCPRCRKPFPCEHMVKELKELKELNDRMTAADFLEKGLGHMKDRAATYDAPAGERSMAKTVAMYNALTGQTMTEEQGWKFMCCLKLARSEQGDFRADNFEDLAAYAGLAGEAASNEHH